MCLQLRPNQNEVTMSPSHLPSHPTTDRAPIRGPTVTNGERVPPHAFATEPLEVGGTLRAAWGFTSAPRSLKMARYGHARLLIALLATEFALGGEAFNPRPARHRLKRAERTVFPTLP